MIVLATISQLRFIYNNTTGSSAFKVIYARDQRQPHPLPGVWQFDFHIQFHFPIWVKSLFQNYKRSEVNLFRNKADSNLTEFRLILNSWASVYYTLTSCSTGTDFGPAAFLKSLECLWHTDCKAFPSLPLSCKLTWLRDDVIFKELLIKTTYKHNNTHLTLLKLL